MNKYVEEEFPKQTPTNVKSMFNSVLISFDVLPRIFTKYQHEQLLRELLCPSFAPGCLCQIELNNKGTEGGGTSNPIVMELFVVIGFARRKLIDLFEHTSKQD